MKILLMLLVLFGFEVCKDNGSDSDKNQIQTNENYTDDSKSIESNYYKLDSAKLRQIREILNEARKNGELDIKQYGEDFYGVFVPFEIDKLMRENVILMSLQFPSIFTKITQALPKEEYQSMYDDALFLLLRGDYPYNITSKPYDEKAKDEFEKYVQILKNSGAKISKDRQNFANEYKFSEAKMSVIDFRIERDENISNDVYCEFDGFRASDILDFFSKAKTANRYGDYQLLSSGGVCEIKGRIEAYGEIWDFDLSSDGRGHLTKEGDMSEAFRTNFFCDTPHCKPCIIDQHDEYANFSDEELADLAERESCRARDELEYRKSLTPQEREKRYKKQK